MMIIPSYLGICAVALFVTGAVANPSLHPPAELVARAGTAAMLNPAAALLKPLEMIMTNGERMRRGLPPKKPHFRRAGAS